MRIELQQPVDGLGRQTRRLRHPFGGPAGRGRKNDSQLLGPHDLDDGVDDRGLAHARAAGDDHDLGLAGHPNRFPLLEGKSQADFLLDPLDGLLHVDPRAGMATLGQFDQTGGQPLFSKVQGRQIDQGCALVRLLDYPLLLEDLVEGRFNDRGGYLQDLGWLL